MWRWGLSPPPPSRLPFSKLLAILEQRLYLPTLPCGFLTPMPLLVHANVAISCLPGSTRRCSSSLFRKKSLCHHPFRTVHSSGQKHPYPSRDFDIYDQCCVFFRTSSFKVFGNGHPTVQRRLSSSRRACLPRLATNDWLCQRATLSFVSHDAGLYWIWWL